MATSATNEGYDPSKDPDRKPKKSTDPGWKYGFWPDLSKKDLTQCTLCGKQMFAGVGRLKRHLAGGFTDVATCSNTTTDIMKEMRAQLDKGSKKTIVPLDDEFEDSDNILGVSVGETSMGTSSRPSSGASTTKRQKMAVNFGVPQSKSAKSIVSMLRKTPEEVVEERHRKGSHQTTIENSTRSQEDRDRVDMHVANFFYENGIPFNAANSRSYEIMVESIGQYGPGYKPPSYHKLRLPLLKKAKTATEKLKEKHEKSWKLHGCTLMCDGWTDKRTRHLINFLVNSQDGTFFLSSVDVSSKVQDAMIWRWKNIKSF